MKRAMLLCVVFISILLLVGCGSGNDTPIYDVITEPLLSIGDSIPIPVDERILTVEGAITNTNVEGTAQFDLSTLESIGLVSYDVDDPFAEKNIVFTGILMSDLLDIVGASDEATTVELIALNDYVAEMAISDIRDYPIMFGMQTDGTNIPDDEGGPAIIIIPYNDYPDHFDHITYDAQWVWSMTRIVVK